jgi:hypothetical protein
LINDTVVKVKENIDEERTKRIKSKEEIYKCYENM